MRIHRLFLIALACFAAVLYPAASATASPGAYKILLTEPYPEGPHALADQIAAFPDFVSFDFKDTSLETPSPAELAAYDAVVSIGDNSYLDPVGWGDSLATYVDQNLGVVVQFSYDSWEAVPVAGRWLSGGYAPFIPGPNENFETTLGAFDPADPLMQGVATMDTIDNTTPTLAPGARLVASWANGSPAIAAKGRAVSVAGWAGDNYGPGIWSGDYGRVVVNAVRALGAQALVVSNATPAGGTVTSSAGGIACGAVCNTILPGQSAVSLQAKPNKKFAFVGFDGACTGLSCDLTLSGGVTSVGAEFVSFGFGKVKARNLKKGRALLQLKAGGPGRLIVFGPKIKQRGKTLSGAGTVSLPIIAKGKAAKTLGKKGKVKVGVRLAFIPDGGVKANLSRPLVLRKNLG